MFYTFVGLHSGKLFHRFVDKDGKRQNRVYEDGEVEYELFLKSNKGDSKSLFEEPLGRITFDSPSSMKDFVKKNGSEIYGQTSPVHQFISTTYPNELIFDSSKVSILNFDIEVAHDNGFPKPEKANDEVLSISLKRFGEAPITFGLKPLEKENYIFCNSEKDLLYKFINYWKSNYPDIITGYNIDIFDIPYLINRIDKVLGNYYAQQLSPFHNELKNTIHENTKRTMKGEKGYEIFGIISYDYYEVYRKFSTKPLESYKLDFVAQTELEKGKVDFSEYNNDLMQLYRKDFEKFITYNEMDVSLVEELDDKLKFIDLAVSIAFMTKSKLSEAFGTVKIWDNLVYNTLKSKNIQPPPDDYTRGESDIVGAFVKEPSPGKYNWVATLDLTSLYPSVIRMFNMSPETLISGEKDNKEEILKHFLNGGKIETENNECMVANGSVFSQNTQGIIPLCMEYLFIKRQHIKQIMKEKKKEKELLLKEIHARGLKV